MAKLPEKKVIIQINPSQFSQKMVLESNVADIMGTCNHPTLKRHKRVETLRLELQRFTPLL